MAPFAKVSKIPLAMSKEGKSKEGKRIYFLGICGTAMGSVAIALRQLGYTVLGSDRHPYPPMSTLLAKAGIPVYEGFDPAHLDPEPDLVVIGNVISRGNPEAEAVLNRRIRYCSLPELLRNWFLWDRSPLVITGTHGKTTTTALIAWILEQAGLQPSYLIAGAPKNFPLGCRITSSPWFVLEGDEYDSAFFDKRSKFLHYLPKVLVINNIEFDHADIFPNLEAVLTSFRFLLRTVPSEGLIVANGDDPHVAQILNEAHTPIIRFGLEPHNDLYPESWRLDTKGIRFRIGSTEFQLPLWGEHNLRNALAALAVARFCGVEDKVTAKAMQSFQGVQKRMEWIETVAGVEIVEDFAHHPTAIRATLQALRTARPGHRLWAVFEPRSNTTRLHLFQKQLAEALAEADCCVIAPVARAHLLPPEQRLDTARLASDLQMRQISAWACQNLDETLRILEAEIDAGDVVCFLSNGSFGGIPQRLIQRLRQYNSTPSSETFSSDHPLPQEWSH